ncbi:MAG: DNA-deoxyinosine glycosylase [Woeseiaceae bacterium]
MNPSEGFPPASRSDARILILGSLPGQRSIDQQQYYAHPKNAFWPIMHELFGIHGSYEQRLVQLRDNRIALWDVLQSSVRPGSLDARIQLDSACANDFETFLRTHTDIQLIAFNGKKAEQLFKRFIDCHAMGRNLRLTGLPSTSPAYAAMAFSGKLMRWRQALAAAADTTTIGS